LPINSKVNVVTDDSVASKPVTVTIAVFSIAFFAGIASGTLYSFLPYISLHEYNVTEPLLSGAFATLGIVLVIGIVIVRKLSSRIEEVCNIGKLAAIFSIIGLLLIVESNNYIQLLLFASVSYACVVAITLSLSMKLTAQTTKNPATAKQNNYNFGARSAGYLAGQGGGSILTAVILPDHVVTVLFAIVALFLLSIWPIFSYMSSNTTDGFVKVAG
jgi:predicted MFS family arabinose efflux permease